LKTQPAGYWNDPIVVNPTKQKMAQAKADIISPYEKALADMDDSKREASK